MKTKKGISLILFVFICIVIIVPTYYYNFVFARTTAIVSIKEKQESFITIKFQNGNELKVKTPLIINPLLKVGEFYHISIYQNKMRGPFLHHINEIETSN